MNKTQLLKKLKKAGVKVYKNYAKYRKNAENANEIKIDISHIQNLDTMADIYEEIIKSQTIALQFDNIMFDVRGAILPHSLTGHDEVHNLFLHLQMMLYEAKKLRIYMMLVHDFRFYEKAITNTSYLMFSDPSGLHTMPMIDETSAQMGCLCFKKNPFNLQQDFVLSLQDKMPGFSTDVGFAMPRCSAIKQGCEAPMSHIPSINKLTKIVLAFANLPQNHVLQVNCFRMKNGQKYRIQKPYYICVDDQQVERIRSGDLKAELSGNSFTDGSSLLDALKEEHQPLALDNFSVKNRHYVVIK